MEEFRKTVSTIFVGSFNLNGSHLSPQESLRWLRTERRKGTTIGRKRWEDSACDTKSTGSSTSQCDHTTVGGAHDENERNFTSSSSAYDSDFVIISLQECPTAPSSAFNTGVKNKKYGFPLIRVLSSSCTSDAPVNKEMIDSVQRNIQSALSEEHHLLADIAMGEPPSSAIAGTIEQPRWYGYIRLLIFAKKEILEKIRMVALARDCPAIIPILAPAGRKADDSSSNYMYKAHRSPDKGGVCVFFPVFDLLVCSLHLCGTNAYKIPEAEFDAIRIKELNIIAEKCQQVIGQNRIDNIILCGDLNFRVEVSNDPKDKTKGGKDYQIVHDVIRQGNVEAIHTLFQKYDRLLCFLKILEKNQKLEKERKDVPVLDLLGTSTQPRNLLLNLRDVFEDYIMGHCMQQGDENVDNDMMMIYPTFPLQVNNMNCRTSCPSNSNEQRSTLLESWGDGPKYSDKRTPSWTDRILWSKTFLRHGYRVHVCGADHKVNSCSDHAPVYAILDRLGPTHKMNDQPHL